MFWKYIILVETPKQHKKAQEFLLSKGYHFDKEPLYDDCNKPFIYGVLLGEEHIRFGSGGHMRKNEIIEFFDASIFLDFSKPQLMETE